MSLARKSIESLAAGYTAGLFGAQNLKIGGYPGTFQDISAAHDPQGMWCRFSKDSTTPAREGI